MISASLQQTDTAFVVLFTDLFPLYFYMNLLLEIPVLPHVKKYLDVKYPGVFRLSDNDYMGNLLSRLLIKDEVYTRMDNYMHRYGKRFLVEVPRKKAADFGFRYVSSMTIVRFNSFIELQIRQEMYGLLDLCEKFKVEKRAVAIRKFMEEYDFTEDDIAYETLLKSYQRYRTRKGIVSGIGKEKDKIAGKSTAEFVHKKNSEFSLIL